ncbi:MAG: hypothetical protein ACLT9P_06460 [Evtepia gabavorous]
MTLSPPATAPSTCWRRSPASTSSSSGHSTPPWKRSRQPPTALARWVTPCSPPPVPSWPTWAWWIFPPTAPSPPPAWPPSRADRHPDAKVAARAEEIQKEIDADYGTVFAKTEVALGGEKANVRTGETNLGDLIRRRSCCGRPAPPG